MRMTVAPNIGTNYENLNMNKFFKMKNVFFYLIIGMMLISCKGNQNIDVGNINAFIQNYFDIAADTLDYTKFNNKSNGSERIICINPKLDALEFFLIDSSEKYISYYKGRSERRYLLKWKTDPMDSTVK